MRYATFFPCPALFARGGVPWRIPKVCCSTQLNASDSTGLPAPILPFRWTAMVLCRQVKV